jgi:hypothetical protein
LALNVFAARIKGIDKISWLDVPNRNINAGQILSR